MSGPGLAGQIVVVIEGDSGIGFATARHARAEGADVIITARDPERLRRAGEELSARSTSAFDATDTARLEAFFDGLPVPIDHLMLTGGDAYHARLADLDFDEARRDVDAQIWLALRVASLAAEKIRSGGSLLFIGSTGDRRPAVGRSVAGTTTAGLPALTQNLALELAPVRVNLIAAGFVDTPLAAAVLGDRLDDRRDRLRAALPIGRVVGPVDVAALAVHLMTNTAVTGATVDIDGGEQLVEA